jgi:two-component system CheB/CheR fusion protein
MEYDQNSSANNSVATVINSTKLFYFKNGPVLLGILTFVVFASLFGTLAYQRFLINEEVNNNQIHHVLDESKDKLNELLEQGNTAARTLALLIQKDTSVKDFDSLASFILTANNVIDAVELVPGGVIKKIYPLKGNENVLGYNILNDPARVGEAKKAIEKRAFFYAGPMQLKQGGIGFVGRMPIFIRNSFWGFSAVVIKLPALLKAAGIDSFDQRGVLFQLSKVNPVTGIEESFIYHSPDVNMEKLESVYLPGEGWKLSAKQINPNKGYVNIYLLTILGYLFSTTLGIVVFIAAKVPKKLNKLVKQRTADLQKKEEKYRSLIEQASDGIIIIDQQGIIVETNQSALLLTGYSEQEMLNKQLENFLLVEGIQNQPLRISELLEGKTLIYERKVQRKDGVIIDVEVNSKLAGDGTLIGFIREITERNNAKILLEKSEIKYRSLFEQASDGIIITNLAGIILEVNNSICAMGGYQVEEMIGRHATDFMPEEDVTGKPLRIDDLINGKVLMYERRMQKKDGTIIDVEINSKMTISKTLIGFVRDITDRNKSAAELNKSIEQYELIAKATNDAIWDYDAKSNEAVGNKNLFNLFGLKQGIDKIDFTVFLSRIHSEDRDILNNSFNNAIMQKLDSLEEEFRFQVFDGSYRHIFDRACFKYDETGQLVRILGVMQDVTNRVENAQKLNKEKELSDSIINNLPEVFFLVSNEGKFLRWNKNLEIISGFTADEIANLNPFDLFQVTEKGFLEEKIKNVFTIGKDVLESNFVKKNGHVVPCYITGIKVEYQGQTCLMGFGLDFSERAKAEILIKESEEKFRSLVENASDSIIILSETGIPTYVSPSFARILGYSNEEMMQLSAFDLTHEDEQENIQKVLKKVLENPGVPIKGHYSRIRHKDGSWRWFEDIITNMLHVPSIKGIVENVRDVTEKLEIEKRILTEKELSDSIINSLPGIFYLYDNTGKFVRWNKNFEKVTGYSSEEISHMHPLDFYDDDLKEVVKERMASTFVKPAHGVELLLLTKSKIKIPFYYNSLSLNYEGVPCIMGMAIDVSDRKIIENALQVSNKNLEQKATELRESNAELERFAYIVSHDLQEPLRMVSSFMKLLEQKYKGQLDEKGEKYINFAVDGADRMKQLIMDLLEYSRTGTNRDVPIETDMNDVMKEVMSVLRNSIIENNAIVEVGQLPVLPKARRLQMFQLMQNLLGNALKYHSDKKPLIKIDAKCEAHQWLFSVQDNGIGIDPAYHEKIFVIFQRLHGRNEFSGTGIGLAICKKIVDKLGGKIWVESEPGVGSTFYFTVPRS